MTLAAFWHAIGRWRAELSLCGSKVLATAPLLPRGLTFQRELKISAARLRTDLRDASGHVPFEQFLLGDVDLAFDKIESSRAPSGPNSASLSSERSTGLPLLRAGRSGSIGFQSPFVVGPRAMEVCRKSDTFSVCYSARTYLGLVASLFGRSALRNSISTLLSRVRNYLHHNLSGETDVVLAQHRRHLHR